MKSPSFWLFVVIAAVAVLSCGGRGGGMAVLSRIDSLAVLSRIDSLADSRPDSALRQLGGMAAAMASAPEAERMYYGLLTVKARDKAYVRHTSDSVILSLVDYYEHDGDRRLLPVAYYYAGRVYRDLNNAVKALSYFQKAENALAETPYRYPFEGNLHSQKGYLLIRQDLYAAAMREFDKAYEYSVERKDTCGIIFSLRDKGDVYLTIKDYDKALLFFDEALRLAKIVKNKKRIIGLYIHIAGCYMTKGNVNKAKDYIVAAKVGIDSLNAKAIYTNFARIYAKLGYEDSSAFYYYKLGEINDVYAKREACLGLANYYSKYKEDSEKGIYYMNLFKAYSDSVQDIRATEAVADIDAKYNIRNTEKKINHVTWQRNSIIVLFLVGVLVFSLVTYFRWRRNYRRKKCYDIEVMDGNSNLSPDSELLTEPCDGKNEVIRQEETRKIESSDGAKQAMQESSTYKKLKGKLVTGKSVSDNEWAELRNVIDIHYDDFTRRITEIHRVSDFELRVCMLIKIDFKVKEIAMLTCHTPMAVTAARRRLCEKFFNEPGSPKRFDDFIRSL